MKIIQFKTNLELNESCSDHIIQKLSFLIEPLVCAATGNSSTGVYQKLVEKKSMLDTQKIKFITLDEWAGLNEFDKSSCVYYLNENLIEPLNIAPKNFIAFNGTSEDPQLECNRIKQYLLTQAIDVCILGIGLNGHIAFNEPANFLQPHAHYTKLSNTSLAHPMLEGGQQNLKYGYTLGMAEILQSQTIFLVINGIRKKKIYEQLINGKITTDVPASFLWLHKDAYCYYCPE